MNSSSRLLLDKPKKEDFQRFYEINSDPETNLFNPNGAMDLETAEKVFEEMLVHWVEQGFGFWSIKEKENPEYVIGFGGIADRLYVDEIKLNLGYRFDKNYWGKGYATEVAQSAVTFGLDVLNKEALFAIVRPKHLASIHVLEKCNMKLVYEQDDVPNEAYSLIYKIEK